MAEQLRWIGLRRKAPAPRLRLIAFPYAGGSAAVYRRWLEDLGRRKEVDFIAIELPGRGQRSSEPLLNSVDQLMENLCTTLLALSDLPCVLFGFSMGALLAYESALQMTLQASCPRYIVLGARIPHFAQRRPRAKDRPSRQAITEKVQRLGGMSSELLKSDLYESHLLPILDADFGMVDSYVRPFPQVLPCPILALAGTEDPEVSPDEIRNWRIATGRGFELEVIEGGHFFLHSGHSQVILTVNRVVEEVLSAVGEESDLAIASSSEAQRWAAHPARLNERSFPRRTGRQHSAEG